MAKNENQIFMGSAALLQATEITDIESGDLLNTAVITLSIFDSELRYPVSILEFSSGGVLPIVEGDTITGETSGATALVGKVSLTGGHWAAGTAAGQLEISGQDGVFQAETLETPSQLADIATIVGESTGLAVVLLGGGQVKIPMNTVGLLATDFIRIESSRKYNGQFDIDAIDAGQAGYVTITAVNIAETFTGGSGEEIVYVGVPNGQDLPMAHDAVGPPPDADGYYDGIQPSNLEGIKSGDTYHLFETITHGGLEVIHKYNWPAGYYSNAKTG